MIFVLGIISLSAFFHLFIHLSFIYFFFLKNKRFSIGIIFQKSSNPSSMSEPGWLLNLILILLILLLFLSAKSPILKNFRRSLVFSYFNLLIGILLITLLLNFCEYCVINYVASIVLIASCFAKDLLIKVLSEVCRSPF